MPSNIQPQKVLHIKEVLKKTAKTQQQQLSGLFSIREKFDGNYEQIPYFVDSGWHNVESSSTREVPALEWVKDSLNSLSFKPKLNFMVIAEAIIKDESVHYISGRLNRSVGDYHCKDIAFKVHDIVPLDRLDTSVAEREILVQDFLGSFGNKKIGESKVNLFEDCPLLLLSEYNAKLWNKVYEDVVLRGGEGIVAKRLSAPFSSGKKIADQLKLKLEDSFDLLCVDLYWTKGEKGNDNMNLLLRRKSGVKVPVRISKHSDIASFTEKTPVGSVCSVMCMKELESGALREPRFDRIRSDKDVKDID
jgi:hypothetical protein